MDLPREYSARTAYNLQDFNDYRLTAAGELAISPYFRHPIRIAIGDDDLELTAITLPNNEDAAPMTEPDRLFVLRNLSSNSPESKIIMDNTRRNMGSIALNGVEYEVEGRSTYIVGRGEDATPQLDLSELTSRRHLQVRVGNMAGNIHFADLDSKNGTIVRIHEEDNNYTTSPRRHFIQTKDGLITYEQQHQRWSR
ncbi:MAG TPA: FHA domain-containing protein [Candidatus Saccharimonadales bacterium]